ncbi:hypothetical protein FIBSPDRAFT_595136 [Athelia psychrophila]|uniref:Uncharacterized protein n=1 Tax=Athelia psychrophila TaxID=1759441 RepID=A0A166H145_9AGAM|nr:hypothetical protein FIBSPDRAFT_595136 [Fibularhizoctonia sp. CBS 109695]
MPMCLRGRRSNSMTLMISNLFIDRAALESGWLVSRDHPFLPLSSGSLTCLLSLKAGSRRLMALGLRDSDETDVIVQLLQAQAATYITWATLTVRDFTVIPGLPRTQRAPGCDVGLDSCTGRGMSNSQQTQRKFRCACLLSGAG